MAAAAEVGLALQADLLDETVAAGADEAMPAAEDEVVVAWGGVLV